MSGTLTCSVFLLCFAILGVMLLRHATISEEEKRVCALSNYREYIDERQICSVKCVNGEERIKCLHMQCHKVLKTNMQNVTMTVDCFQFEEFFTYIYDMNCDENQFNVYYNTPKCRTDCYSGVKRTICYSDRCSRRNSNIKNCTMHCDFAEQGTPCTHEKCHPETYYPENGQTCTVTCDSGYKYITCSYLECEKRNFTYYDYIRDLNYECSEYCENGERYYVCPAHPKWHVLGYTYPTNRMGLMIEVPNREAEALYFDLSKFRQDMESIAREKFKNYDDEE